MSTWPQVPAEQRTQRLWCGRCQKTEIIGIEEVAEEMGWSKSVCPDCATRRSIDAYNLERFGTTRPNEPWNPSPRWAAEGAKP